MSNIFAPTTKPTTKPIIKPTTKPITKPTPSPTTKGFIDSLTQKEKKAYDIAENFLETSFDLKRSIGFKKWWATKSK